MFVVLPSISKHRLCALRNLISKIDKSHVFGDVTYYWQPSMQHSIRAASSKEKSSAFGWFDVDISIAHGRPESGFAAHKSIMWAIIQVQKYRHAGHNAWPFLYAISSGVDALPREQSVDVSIESISVVVFELCNLFR